MVPEAKTELVYHTNTWMSAAFFSLNAYEVGLQSSTSGFVDPKGQRAGSAWLSLFLFRPNYFITAGQLYYNFCAHHHVDPK
jgi:hypothetical protein